MKKILASIFSLTILVSVFLPAVGFTAGVGGCGSDGSGCLTSPLNSSITSLPGLVDTILNKIVLPIGAVIVVFFIIYSGFLFVTAQGNDKKLEDAKKTFLYTIIGAAVLLGSVAISAAIKGTLCAIVDPTTLPSGFCTPPPTP